MARQCLTIILAAGKGTRMKSPLPKVLHNVAGLPMLAHVVAAARQAGSDKLAIVTGHGGDLVANTLEALDIKADLFEQKEQRGTGDAVSAACAAIDQANDDVLVLFGDTPLMDSRTLSMARAQLADGADVVVIGFRTEEPAGYGRLVEQAGQLTAIVEHVEATEEQRAINFCNGGLMAFKAQQLPKLLDQIDNKNNKGEYYLTDAVEIANAMNLKVVAVETAIENTLGVNTRVELAAVETIWQNRARQRHMLAGVAMIAPETVYFHHDTVLGDNVSIEPDVFFGPGVTIGNDVKIKAYCHIEGASIGDGAEVGPFARLRPGAKLGQSSKVGNFCEVKNAHIAKAAKVNHLTYIGDASIGEAANIGAGTITCNYDGINKSKTVIGSGAFIGSNSSLVAPVTIGNSAYVASGSVITNDVPDDSVGFGRARQENKRGLASKLREHFMAIKNGTVKR